MAEAKQAPKPRLMKRADIGAFLTAIAGGNPDPKTELDYETPFMLLVAVVLSAQTTDVAVNKVGKALFAAAPDPAAMVALGVAGVGALIRSIGLWQAKAKNVVALSALLLERHGGEVPGDRDALEALPGVGRKTANVVLNEIFGQATMAVDTHIFRLGNRTGIAPGATPRAVEDGLLKRVPKEMLRPAHLWLILHGRYVCKARTPECWRCAGAAFCTFKPKVPAPLPAPKKSPSAKRPTG
jgi:endonuclease-3